jgi:hypothetical protein
VKKGRLRYESARAGGGSAERRKGEKYMFRHSLDNEVILPGLRCEDLKLQLLRSAGLQRLDDRHLSLPPPLLNQE